MSARWLVVPAAGTRLDGDEAIEVDVDGRSVAAVRPDVPVIVGEIRPATRLEPASIEVVAGGWRLVLEVEDVGRAALRRRASRDRPEHVARSGAEVHAIIPGRVVSVAVSVGDRVGVGQPLIVVEAMKMQNEIRSTIEGVVERVGVTAGQTIELGDLLVVLATGAAP